MEFGGYFGFLIERKEPHAKDAKGAKGAEKRGETEIPNTKHQIPNFKLQAPNSKLQTPSSKLQGPDTKRNWELPGQDAGSGDGVSQNDRPRVETGKVARCTGRGERSALSAPQGT